jgi:hypothetical protein
MFSKTVNCKLKSINISFTASYKHVDHTLKNLSQKVRGLLLCCPININISWGYAWSTPRVKWIIIATNETRLYELKSNLVYLLNGCFPYLEKILFAISKHVSFEVTLSKNVMEWISTSYFKNTIIIITDIINAANSSNSKYMFSLLSNLFEIKYVHMYEISNNWRFCWLVLLMSNYFSEKWPILPSSSFCTATHFLLHTRYCRYVHANCSDGCLVCALSPSRRFSTTLSSRWLQSSRIE